MKLEGKTAIVTGASSGIGAAIVRALRAEGVRVAGGARRVERLDADVALELDVTDPASCERFVAAAVESSAAWTSSSTTRASRSAATPSTSRREEDEEVVLETNVHGLIRMTRLCLPHLRDGGHIVNMGSVAGHAGVSERRPLRHVEVRRARLHARAARGSARPADPDHERRAGLVETDFSTRALPRRRGEGQARSTRTSPRRPIRPEDVAECVLFALTRPPHVNVDEIVVTALAQSSGARILREE